MATLDLLYRFSLAVLSQYFGFILLFLESEFSFVVGAKAGRSKIKALYSLMKLQSGFSVR